MAAENTATGKKSEIDMQTLLSGKQALIREDMLKEGAPKKNKFLMPMIVAGIIGVIAAVLLYVYFSGREETDDAYVNGHISNISSRVSGTVERVLVEENQPVKAGQVLVQLDPTDYNVNVAELEASLQQAKYEAAAAHEKIGQSTLSAQGQTTQATENVSSGEAEIASCRADVAQADADIQAAKAKITELEAQVKFAQSDFERYKLVFASRGVTQQQYDQAKERLDVATAQRDQGYKNLAQVQQRKAQALAKVNQAIANLRMSKGGVTSAIASQKQELIDAQNYESQLATVKSKEAQIEEAKLKLSYTEIRAPIDGRIGRKSVEVGQHVEPGQLLVSVVQDDPWVTANYKETQVGRMRPGQPVEIKIDTFPGKVFKAHVDSISPASGAKFSMLPPDNATGNFTKVVQRMEVKLNFDKGSLGSYKGLIAPGMSCETTVLVKEK